jgi:phenylalanyl-tRNA synthetase beta chain
MRISFQWLNELINLKNVDFDYLVEKLTLGGFEVEETFEIVTNNQSDTILDITSTANRSDSLYVKGIAKEVSALLDTDYNLIQYSQSFLESEKHIKSSLDKIVCLDSTLDSCSSFFAIIVENISVHDSPKWLKQKLIGAGIQPFNNLLDFQNYITLETGYPFEFYDIDKIKSKLNTNEFSISLNYNNKGSFLASNGCIYQLTSDILTVKANNEVLSLSGIIPNKEFLYTDETKSLLIEGSIFNSKKIRQTSRAIGLRTDRSARYEKGLNSNKLIESLWRLLYLLKVSNSKINCQFYSAAKGKDFERQIINLNYQTIIKILGPVICLETKEIRDLNYNEISSYLNRLNFEFIFNEKSLVWEVSIPIERNEDITREIDIIEEIGRLHGFNNFVTFLPEISKIGSKDLSYKVRKKLTSALLSEGFTEVINYSLVKEQNPKNIKIINPLIQDYSTLRSSLLPNLVETVSNNLKQGNLSLEAFEYGHVFLPAINELACETEQIAGIFGGIELKKDWLDSSEPLSWFKSKGKIENIFKKLNISTYWRSGNLDVYKHILHPYRTSNLYLEAGIKLGVFGQIHPIIAKQFNISSSLYLFEFNFELLKNEFKYQKLPIYEAYSTYPKIVKDLSFIISQEISFELIKNTIFSIGTKFLTSIYLKDEYKGKTIPQGKTSLCIQLTFQSNERTLISKDIEKIIENIKHVLIEQFEITVRV